MSLFTKYTVVTDGEKWALKRIDFFCLASFWHYNSIGGGFWETWPSPNCWTDSTTENSTRNLPPLHRG